MPIFGLMNLFNFLKKKRTISFEELLKKAADKSSYRTEFINRILDENLLIISNSNLGPERFTKLEQGAKINVLRLKDGRIPVFTSKERVHDKGIFNGDANYIEAKAKDIFELLRGATLILNPYSDYGKEFNPEEIQRILDGTYFKSREIKIEKATEVKIGQPAKYPTDVVDALIKLFSNRPEVINAYLGWIHYPETVEPPHYIFAIETIGDWRTLSDEAGFLVQQILGADDIIDFIPIKDGSGLDGYFINKVKPFYAKIK